MVGLYLHSRMSSWRSALLIKHRDNFTLPYLGIDVVKHTTIVTGAVRCHQLITDVFPGRDVKLTTHLHIVLGAMSLIHHRRGA
jgi:hypothetical protein